MTRRNLGAASLLTLPIAGIYAGSALGARWIEIGVQAEADSLNNVIRVLRPINEPLSPSERKMTS